MYFSFTVNRPVIVNDPLTTKYSLKKNAESYVYWPIFICRGDAFQSKTSELAITEFLIPQTGIMDFVG